MPARVDPIAEQRQAAPAPVRSRVLVVDDDAAIRSLLARLLHEHDVETASSAQLALARIDAGVRYDAIVSDIAMPGMSGLELRAVLERVAPDQARRMIFLSGSLPDDRGGLGDRYLAKPFDAARLAGVVREVCAGR